MSGFLLDTCVLSEFKKPKPDAGLYAWLANVDASTTYISVFTLGELRYGIALLPNSAKRRELERWITSEVLLDFARRTLPFDAEVADRWGTLRTQAQSRGTPLPPVDGMLAATALQHNLTVVTRNELHFRSAFVCVLNPWKTS